MFTNNASARQEKNKSKAPSGTSGQIGIADNLVPSVIGSGLVMVGNTYSDGQVEVSGVYQGNIKCKSLIVRKTANITGDLVAEEILIGGRVEGTIRGRNVTLEEHSDVDGDIYHETLAVTQGARFSGRSYLTDEDTTVAKSKAQSTAGSAAADNDKAPAPAALTADAA